MFQKWVHLLWNLIKNWLQIFQLDLSSTFKKILRQNFKFDGHVESQKAEALKKLVQDGQVLRVGCTSQRLVSQPNADIWSIRSFRIPKEFRSLNADETLESVDKY